MKFGDPQTFDWFSVFEALRNANPDSVCHAFSRLHDTYATRRQVAALLGELSRNELSSEHLALRRLADQREILEPYVFFDGVDSD